MDTPDFFIGARLGAARAKAGISLEKAAKDTRIRVLKLRELEADDFSGFAHPTYARLFLLDYAEYLGLPLDEIRPMLPDQAGSAAGGFQYIDALAADLPRKSGSPRRRRRWIFILAIAAVGFILLLAAALFTYFTIQKIERVARSKPLAEVTASEPQPTPEATPETTPGATPDPTPEPEPEPPALAAPAPLPETSLETPLKIQLADPAAAPAELSPTP